MSLFYFWFVWSVCTQHLNTAVDKVDLCRFANSGKSKNSSYYCNKSLKSRVKSANVLREAIKSLKILSKFRGEQVLAQNRKTHVGIFVLKGENGWQACVALVTYDS